MNKKESLLVLFKETLESSLKEKLEAAKTKKEKCKILDSFEALDIGNIFSKVMDEAARDIFSFMRETMYEEVMRFRADEQEFLARQEQKWYRAFVSSESLYIMTLDTAMSYAEYVENLPDDEREQKGWTYTAMKHIHGRSMQIYLEIITLMKNGFADGAYARWRSLYELSIIAAFITEHGESVAKKFIEASDTDDRYDWTRESKLFDKKKGHITFNDIQKVCDINTEIWRHQYNLANKAVHASPQGTFGRLCNYGENRVIPVGRSDYGITTPGEHSAISLLQISSMFFALFPESDTIVQLKTMERWLDVIRECYFKTHDDVFPDDEPLWDDALSKAENDKEGGCL